MTGWRQQINLHEIVRPTCLYGKSNGELDTSVLSVVTDGAGKRIGRLNLVAARSWTAMVAAAKSDGVFLTATDTYRDRKTQQRLWDTRYDSVNHGNGGRTCGGDHRFLKDGMATSACPGTSNHGWGGAVDKGNSQAAHAWLEMHASAFGWEWELASESWHLHYWPGDQIPQSVLEFEAKQGTPTTQEEDDDMVIYTPQPGAGPDGGKSFAVQGNERRHLGPSDYQGLIASGHAERKPDAHAWQVVLDTTVLKPANSGKPGTG